MATTAPSPDSTPSPSTGVRSIVTTLSLLVTASVTVFALVVFLRRPPSVIHFRTASSTFILSWLTLSSALHALAVRRQLGPTERRVGFRLALRFGLAGLLGGTVTYLTFFQPFKALFFLFFWGCWLGLYPLLILLGPRLARSMPARMLRGLDLLLFNVTLLLVGGELVLSVTARLWPIPLFASASNAALDVIAQHRLAPGQMFLGFPCDELGNYDRSAEESTAATRITAIGDSFSVGIVPHYFHYTTSAERALDDVEIYNIGVNAIGPAEYLHLLRHEALPLRPKAVLLALFVGNDAHESTRFRPKHAWLRRWFDRNNILLWLLPKRLMQITNERERRTGSAVGRIQGEEREGAIVQTPEALIHHLPWLADPSLEKPTFSDETYLEIETVRARGICDPAANELLDSLLMALEEIRRVAGSTPLFVLLIPDELQVEDRLWNRIVDGPLRGHSLVRDHAQRRLLDWLREREIPALDLLPLFRAALAGADGERHLYHLRDSHLNARGNALAGSAVADFLRRELEALNSTSDGR